MTERRFGPYLIEVDDDHAVITHADRGPADPTFYELQHIKDLAFGAQATAIEVFPPQRELVDGEHQRHLWRVEGAMVPSLFNGKRGLRVSGVPGGSTC